MNGVIASLRRVVLDLQETRARWVLVGGLAVSAWVEPRFTRDVDIAVSVDGDEDAEKLVRVLLSLGHVLGGTVEQEYVGRLATVRLLSPAFGSQGVVVDLLFASSGIEPELVEAARTLEVFPGLPIPVARLGHLIALKLLAIERDRPQDRGDLVALADAAHAEDWDVASSAVRLITARGFHRDRDLRTALDKLRRTTTAE